MLIIRTVQESDIDPLFELIQKSEYGLTTLKISKDKLSERIEESIFAFRKKSEKAAGQPYVFVLEDLSVGKIVGTSAIYSKVGGYEPFYSYEIETAIHHSEVLGIRKEIDVLHLKAEHNGPSEIGSLFLSPDYWGSGHGRLLSISRFLFMAEFPNRFDKETIAEMRGIVQKDGHSPLWDALGSHFFQIEFPKAETLTAESKQFIADLMPKHPIYIPLLPGPAQEVIGKVHDNTQPALTMLQKEGFEHRNLVDIFDGGPTMHCETNNIRAVKESRCGTVNVIKDHVPDGMQLLVSNSRLEFRACLGEVAWNEGSACIDQVTALRLNLKVGDRLRVVELRSPSSNNF